MNKNHRNISILIIILLILVFFTFQYYESIDNQQAPPINHKIPNDVFSIVQNKYLSGENNITFILNRTPLKFLTLVYYNYSTGYIELLNPQCNVEMNLTLHERTDVLKSVISSDPPAIVFNSGTWHLKYNIKGNAHIMLYTEG